MARSGPLQNTEALLSALRNGDEEAFESIFHAYYPRVFAVVFRLLGSAAEAEDVAQETFLRLYLRPLPAGREHNLPAWLLRVATNLAYNAIRHRNRQAGNEARAGSAADAAAGIDETVIATEAAERVRRALAGLPVRQARIILLRHAGLSYAELADALGVAPGSVGTLLALAERAFKELYDRLEEDGVW